MDLEHIAAVGVTLVVSVPTTAVLFRFFVGNLKQQNIDFRERIAAIEKDNRELNRENIRLSSEHGHLRGQRDRMSGSHLYAIVSANHEGAITDWSSGAEELFGYSAYEIIGKPITLLIPAQFRDKHRDGFGPIARGEKLIDPTKSYKAVARCKNGDSVKIESKYATWKDPATGQIRFEATIQEDRSA